MYQYRVERVTRLKGTNQVTAILDLGFSIKMKVTFKLGRIEAPEFDFNSDIDPEIAVRNFIYQWFKTAPKPLYVHMDKNSDGYIAEVLDKNGRVLADDVAKSNSSDDDTQVIPYDYEKHGAVPATTGPGLS